MHSETVKFTRRKLFVKREISHTLLSCSPIAAIAVKMSLDMTIFLLQALLFLIRDFL